MQTGKRLGAAALVFAQILVLAGAQVAVVPALVANAATTCGTTAGKDGSPGTLAGTYNTYYQPPAGTLTAGATSVNLGTMDTTNGGATTAVTAGDELLIIQMQDGSFNDSNSSAYGDGSTGSGFTAIGTAGEYEYVGVSAVSGSIATITSTGSGGGLLNTYTQAAATPTSGQKSYQIVRVPQYITATLSSSFSAAYWDGKTGGVAAIDMSSTLNLGGASIYATGDGFRGGGVTIAGTTPASVLNNDWVDSALMNGTGNAPGFGSKGEGVLGSPDYVFYYTNFTTPSTPSSPTVTNSGANGYPGGDQGMGAPGNAGGGGTDDDPVSNDQNTGGGGGGNGGSGGKGGYPWTPNYSGSTPLYSNVGVHTATGYSAFNSGDIGGRGGSSMSSVVSVSRALMGGGGGAGVNNNGAAGSLGSSGGPGGGIVLMRLANVSGSAATVYANGMTGQAPNNDGGGGGGAGGTVIITSPSTFSNITVHADGGVGTTANASATGAANQHGPGGGGGGGIVITSSSTAASVAGAAQGTTTTSATTYGAVAGSNGVSQTAGYTSVPGIASGAQCYTGATSGTLGTGPVGGYNTTGSFDGNVTANDNNDFTAVSFMPAGATFTNSSTTPGSPSGNTITQGPTTINVENDFRENNTGGKSLTVTFNATAPVAPSGWTVQICADNAGTPSCTAGGSWASIGTAGSTASSTYAVPRKTDTGAVHYWAVYTAPVNTIAYTRYDASIVADDGTNTNTTHNELYDGFVPLTKTVSVVSNNCPSGVTPGPTGACPGGLLLYTIDYRNIVVGAGSESTFTSAWPKTSAGSLVITENGLSGPNTWGKYSKGLKEVLVAGANGTTTFGDTTPCAGCATSTSGFTGDTVGSTSFTDRVGGPTFQLVPYGISGTYQGTLTFRVTVK